MKLKSSILALLTGLALSTGLPQAAIFSLEGVSPAFADDEVAASDEGTSVGDVGADSDQESDGVTDVGDGDGAISNDTCNDNTNESLTASRC